MNIPIVAGYTGTNRFPTVSHGRMRQGLVRYGVPFLSVTSAIIATVFLSKLTNEFRSSSVFFLAAVMVSTWYGGLAAGLFTIALSVVSIDFFFLKPITAYGLTAYDIPLIIVFSSLAIVIGYLVDFRRQAENQLRLTNEELELRVAGRTRELAEANRVKDEFLAMVSHDLRAPLTAILGWIEIIEKNGSDGEFASHALAIIKRNAIAQTHLVSDLLDLTSMTAGGISLEFRSLDLQQLLTGAKERFVPLAAKKDIELGFSTGATAIQIQADPDRLAQVLNNLLSNAIKFTPEGGQVVVSVEQTESALKLRISDTGCGIDKCFLPFVFDEFRRGNAAHNERGLGLGLTIVKHIVEGHRGQITVYSDGPGKGTIFTVTLPREPYRRAPVQLSTSGLDFISSSPSFLVTDSAAK